MNNKWQPIIKLALIMLAFVTVVYFGSSYTGNLIVKRNKEKKKTVALTGRVESMQPPRPINPKYEELLKLAQTITYPRDPFMREKVAPVVEVPEVVQEGPLLLQGIMWEENSAPKAMINGEVIEMGSFIDLYMVVDIQSDHVILIDNDPAAPPDQRTIQLWLTSP